MICNWWYRWNGVYYEVKWKVGDVWLTIKGDRHEEVSLGRARVLDIDGEVEHLDLKCVFWKT